MSTLLLIIDKSAYETFKINITKSFSWYENDITATKIECFLHGSNGCIKEKKNVKAYTCLFLTPELVQFEIFKLARAVVLVMEIALLVQPS